MAGRQPTANPAGEGARLIFLAEPHTHNTFRAFLALWGVIVSDGYIRDIEGSQPNAPRTLRVGTLLPASAQRNRGAARSAFERGVYAGRRGPGGGD